MTENSTQTPGPREVVEGLFRELPSRDVELFLSRLAPDAIFEIPFTIPGVPSRLEGREAIREHLQLRWQHTSAIEVHEIFPTIYETPDPAVLLAENEIDMTVPGTGRDRVRTAICVIHVHDGVVTLFRDYIDTARLSRVMG